MLKINFEPRRLKHIDQDGLTYQIKSELVYISFEACRSNWVSFVSSSAEFKTTDLRQEQSVCVGQRYICGKPAYIEFFSEPHTFFVFRFGLFCPNPPQSFINLQQSVFAAGWSTLDLS